MGIHFNNPIGNSLFHPASGASPEKNRAQKKEAVEPESFLSLLRKVSDSAEPPVSRPDQSQSALEVKKALELCQRMKLQMNESLLRIVSDAEEENGTENSLITGLEEILPRQEKAGPLLSKIRQAPSETLQPEIQASDRMVEKKVKIDGDGSRGRDIDGIIQKASSLYGVDSGLIRGVIEAESSFNPDAISSKGAKGLMQLMPETAKELGVKDPLDPAENIMGGTRYLKKLLDRYDGSVPHALAAYNWGMGNLDSRRSRMPAETRNYVAKITGNAFS